MNHSQEYSDFSNEAKKIFCELRDKPILVSAESLKDLNYCPLCGEKVKDEK